MTGNGSHGADHDLPMTLQEHLAELRGRLIKATLTIAAGMVGGLFAADRVQGYFLDLVARIAPDAEVIATTAQEKVGVYFTIALYLGIIFAMPVLIYQGLRFLAPGLTRNERRYAYALLPGVLACFLGGVAFALMIAIPQMLTFLLNFGDERIKTTPRAAELLGFCSDLALWTGLAFELPILMFLLATINIAPYRLLRRGRKWAAVGLMIIAAIITPAADALSMLIIWAPLYLLFELGLILARFARPRTSATPVGPLVVFWLAWRGRNTSIRRNLVPAG